MAGEHSLTVDVEWKGKPYQAKFEKVNVRWWQPGSVVRGEMTRSVPIWMAFVGALLLATVLLLGVAAGDVERWPV